MESVLFSIEDQRKALAHLKKIVSSFETKQHDTITRGYIDALLEDIQHNYSEFKNIHNKIISIVRDNSIADSDVPYIKEDVYYAYYDLYITFRSKLLDIVYEFNSPSSPAVHASTFAAPSTRNETFSAGARLPKIDLPIFSGDYLAWIPFRDTFLSLVHQNSALSSVQKYFYLKGSCTATPLEMINEYPASDASYKLAWDALESRYHNKRKLVDEIMKRLFSIPSVSGSSNSVKQLLDTTRNCLALLKTLDISTNDWDVILVYLTTQKLDQIRRKEWEQYLDDSVTIPPVSTMLQFLEKTFRTLESVEELCISPQNKENDYRKKTVPNLHRRIVNANAATTKNNSCPNCNHNHPLYKCFKFLSMSLPSRKQFILSKNLCINCLNSGHIRSKCSTTTRCRLCKENHHTLLHENENITSVTISSSNPPTGSSNHISNNSNINAHTSIFSTEDFKPVLLATIIVMVTGKSGTYNLRALVDTGAQATFISGDAAQLLNLPRKNTNVGVSGIGHTSTSIRKYITLNLRSQFNSDFNLITNAFILSKLTAYRPQKVNRQYLPDLSNYNLADSSFDKPVKIDLILGSDVYGDILLPGMEKHKTGILMQETQFGWIVSGPVDTRNSERIQLNVHLCSLEEQLKSFWEQEELSDNSKIASSEELACEKLFATSHTRDSEGRYTVCLPFKALLAGNQLPVFKHTDYAALKRFTQLESSFLRRPTFARMYKDFMNEYVELNHMKKIGTYPQDVPDNSFFFPHHGVLRESSSTTKLRVVFDGGNRRPPQKSLNEELAAGPALQNDLPAIITNWRRFRYGFTADLEKMFRQINVCKEHQNYQCILWRNNPNEDLGIYKLTTVTYGSTSAPYLAIRVLHQLAADEENSFPLASSVLKSDTYVDDVISGADSPEEAIHLHRELCSLLHSGQFNLRKWSTNCSKLVEHIPEEDRLLRNNYEIKSENFVKALGLSWNPDSDCFNFRISFKYSDKITKRILLSEASKLFDPLGWLAPTTILAKIMFQKLWLTNSDWDDDLPSSLEAEWKSYRESLKFVEDITVPRWIFSHQTSTVDLHGFCDASQLAYAAAVYVRVKTVYGDYSVNLLRSKTKVAPLKTVAIPRLELCGAVLLAKLMTKTKNQLKLNVINTFYWCDSMTVLSWIHSHSSKWTVYIANRVGNIQRLSNPNQWQYVPTTDNPADCASRGINASDLKTHSIWWKGPEWLNYTSEAWPKQPRNFGTDLEKRIKSIASHMVSVHDYPEIINKFSSWFRLLRVTTYVLRFRHNLMANRNKLIKITGFLKSYELQQAEVCLIKATQAIDFPEELELLKMNKPISNRSRILQFYPILDGNGIIRVGGRLRNSALQENCKHPILLSKQNPLSFLIFSDAHQKTMHGGPEQMRTFVMKRYWILGAKVLAKSLQRKCVTCFKFRCRPNDQLMGDLPTVRVNPTRPFSHSGLDYAGPINIKVSSLRNSSTSKAYICLFICMCTKAVHLELVSSLTTNAFLAAFRRFISRRGKCTDLYSDCGTTFIGANKELQYIQQSNHIQVPDHLAESLSNGGTTWHFLPPASPHFGGLWEAGVKSTKHHLYRVLKDRLLNFEELTTLLAQIESCLNSRPLTDISTDPSESNVLTPSHFLIGEPSTCLSESVSLDSNIDHLTRWKMVERLKQHFWNRWSREYLSSLQSRAKWKKIQRNLKKGDLVFLLSEKSSPGNWPLARVEELHPGKDELIRVVTLLCNGKLIRRPISKICLLPIDESKASSVVNIDHDTPKN